MFAPALNKELKECYKSLFIFGNQSFIQRQMKQLKVYIILYLQLYLFIVIKQKRMIQA